jgi:transposase
MRKCGLKQDRDIIAVRNLLHRSQINVETSPVHSESPPMTRGGKG